MGADGDDAGAVPKGNGVASGTDGDGSARTPFDDELRRTAFQRKVVSRQAPNEVLDLAIAFFNGRGYRAGRTGRPNQVFVLGRAEGGLPRVTGEVMARADVGKPGVTLVTLDAAGERLGPAMADFARELRERRSRQAGKSASQEEPGG